MWVRVPLHPSTNDNCGWLGEKLGDAGIVEVPDRAIETALGRLGLFIRRIMGGEGFFPLPSHEFEFLTHRGLLHATNQDHRPGCTMVKFLHMLGMFPAILDVFQLPALWALIYLLLRLRKKIMKSKIVSKLVPSPAPVAPVAHQFPIRLLPTTIREALIANLITNRLVTALPHHVMVKNDKTWMFYQTPKPNCTSFCLEINLQTKAVSMHMGEYEGAYADRNVDVDKTKRNLDKDKVVVKGYFTSRNGRNELYQENVEITFHPSQVLKVYPKLEISDRERQVLFCFGSLRDGYLRREALCRLDVTKPELENLVLKGLLKRIGQSFELTNLSEANRLPAPKDNNVAVDQW